MHLRRSVSLESVKEAASRLDGVARRTPLLPAPGISNRADAEIRLKSECFQHTRSFKIRGAFNTLSVLGPEGRAGGVVAYSSGNHGQGVAWAARLLDTRALVVTPITVTAMKEEGIRSHGAEVIKAGHTSLERRARAEEIARERGMAIAPGFDHPDTIAGQGTVGLEIAEDWPEVDLVLVPVGGGGLIAGIALALKTLRPEVEVVGVEPATAPSMQAALDAEEPVTLPRPETMADGLASVRVCDLTLELVRAHVDRMVSVEEEEIFHATAHLLLEEGIVAEYSGAATTAALLQGKVSCAGRRVAAVVSGGNIGASEVARLADWWDRHSRASS